MKNLISTVIAINLCITAIGQTNYYVSTTGNNTDTGSQGLPWLTLQYGLDQLSPGDTLNIMTGTYNEKVQFNVSGTASNMITLRNNNNDVVVIDGTGITGSIPVVEIYDHSYIIIEGLEIANNEMLDAQGILIENNCNNITIRNNKIYNINFSSNPSDPANANTNSQPLIVYGTDPINAIFNLIIEGNEIYNSRTGYSEALAVNGNVDGFQVINNLVHDVTNIGIDIIGHEGTSPDAMTDQARNGTIKGNTIYNCLSSYATSGGIYVDGGKDLIIENNISYKNGYGIEIGCENVGKSADNILIRNNLFYDNEICGIALGGFDYPTGSGKVTNTSITNNTLFKNDFSGDFTGELYLTYSENCEFKNNLFYTTNQNTFCYAENAQPGLIMDYNMIYCPAGASSLEYDWNGVFYTGFSNFQSGTGLEGNSAFSDPLFVNASLPVPDLHLQGTSPAIDAGDPLFTLAIGETDIDGENRITGTNVDVGADEFYSTSGVDIADNDLSINVFPNPTKGQLNIHIYNSTSKITELKLIDINGRILFDKKFRKQNKEQQQIKLNLNIYRNGIYLLQLIKDNGIEQRKIILMKNP